MFELNLQLFGGSGSSSGLGGKGGGGSGEPKGYLFQFFKGGASGERRIRWVEGDTPAQALKNAKKIAKKYGYEPSNPIGEHLTYDEIKKKIKGIRKAEL